MTRNIALVGRMGSGKTTVANELVAHYGYTRVALADAVKEQAVDLINYWLLRYSGIPACAGVDVDYVNDHKPLFRAFLQWLGTELGRQWLDTPNRWLDEFFARAKGIDGPIVCDDVRFVNEADALRRAGFVVVRLYRSERQRAALDNGIEGHVSEVETTQIKQDFTVYNGDERRPRRAADIIVERIAEGWNLGGMY